MKHRPDSGPAEPLPAVTIAGESAFNNALALERRRSERTGRAVGLVLVDLRGLRGSQTLSRLSWIARSVCAGMRETDITGWYRAEATLGIILTTLNGTSRADLETIMDGKLRAILAGHVDPTELDRIRVECYLFPDDDGPAKGGPRRAQLFYAAEDTRYQRARVTKILKRSIDLGGSVLGLLVLSPVFVLAAVLIRTTSRGPIFFRQTRIGQCGEEFTCLKFRTMQTDADSSIHRKFVRDLIEKRTIADSGTYKIRNDPRVTSVGRYLRKSSMDELPQLINVLKGEMSLVGPRPPIPYELDNYELWHLRRISGVRPGITGEWQVRGRSRTTFDEMVRMDLNYISNRSIWLDMKILLKTPLAVLSGDGAH